MRFTPVMFAKARLAAFSEAGVPEAAPASHAYSASTAYSGATAMIAPAVALPEPNADGSDGRGPVVQRSTRFLRCTTESY